MKLAKYTVTDMRGDGNEFPELATGYTEWPESHAEAKAEAGRLAESAGLPYASRVEVSFHHASRTWEAEIFGSRGGHVASVEIAEV